MIAVIIVSIALFLFVAYACCVISGYESEREERR